MATERVEIIVSQTGAVTVKKAIADIGPAAKSSASAIDSLKGALASYIGLQAAQKVGELADAGTRLTNSLKQAGLSGQGLADEQSKLFDIATANGQSVNELAGIYQKLSAVQGQLGASGADVDKVLTGIAASMKLSSAGSAAQAGSLQQLSQLFGGVNVQAQEYNSLIDGAYPLLQAVAAGSERFGGSVANLTAAVKAGSVTTKEFFDALLKGSDANIALAASFNLTIGQALTNFNTKLIQGLLYINNTTGAFNAVAIAINFAANNLGILLAILSPIIAGFTVLAVEIIGGYFITAVSAATTATGSLISALGKLLLLLIANPAVAVFIAITAALATIITLTGGWEAVLQTVIDAINAAIVGVKNLLTLFGATFTDGQFEIKVTGAELVGQFNKTVADIKAALPAGAAQAAPKLQKAVADGGKDAAQEIKAGTAEAAAAVYGALNGVAQQARGAIQAGADYTYNQVTGAYTKGAGDVQKAMQTGGDSAGASVKQALQTGGQSAAQSLTLAGQTVSGAIAEALQTSALEIAALIKEQMRAAISETVATAAKLRAEARATLANIGRGGSSGSGGGGSGDVRSSHFLGPNGENSSHYIGTYTSKDYSAGGGYGVGGGTGAGGGSGGVLNQGGGFTIINKVDPSDTIQAINTQKGGQTIVNVIKQNAAEVKAILGVA